jgi:hypothetical protein
MEIGITAFKYLIKFESASGRCAALEKDHPISTALRIRRPRWRSSTATANTPQTGGNNELRQFNS